MYTAVQVAIFVACVAFVFCVPFALLGFYRLHKTTEHLLRVVKEVREELKPLVRTTNTTVEKLHALTVMAQDQWHEIGRASCRERV